MANQTDSRDGKPRPDPSRPSPDVQGNAPDGQMNARAPRAAPQEQGDDAVAPPRHHGPGDDANPVASGALDFDDGTMDRPAGTNVRTGGTWQSSGADSGRLGRPAEMLSDRIGPSDPDRPRQR